MNSDDAARALTLDELRGSIRNATKELVGSAMSNPPNWCMAEIWHQPRSCCYLPYGPGEGSQGKAYCQAHGSHMRRGLREPFFWLVARARGRGGGWRRRARCGEAGGAGSGTWSLLRLSRAHFVERERKPLGAIAVSPCDMPAQLANESFRADHVSFGNSVGAVVQVLMRSDIPAAEAFFRDHLRASPTGQKFRRPTGPPSFRPWRAAVRCDG